MFFLNELTNHIIKKLHEKQISNNFGLPSLSNIGGQQMPYSRIPRGLGVSRGEGRENIKKQNIKHTDEVYLSKNNNSIVYTVPQNNYDENKEIWPSEIWNKEDGYIKNLKITRINDYTGKLFREFYKIDHRVDKYNTASTAIADSFAIFYPKDSKISLKGNDVSLYDLKIKEDWPKGSPGAGIFYGKIVSGAYFGNAVFGYTMGKNKLSLDETIELAEIVAHLTLDKAEQTYDIESIISGWYISQGLYPWPKNCYINNKKYTLKEINKYHFAKYSHSSREIKQYLDNYK